MSQPFKFNRVFGLSISDRFDETYYSILTFVLLIVTFSIFVNSYVDYSKMQIRTEQMIRRQYHSFVTQLLMDEIRQVGTDLEDVKTIVVTAPITITERTARPVTPPINLETKEKAIIKRVEKNRVFQAQQKASTGAPGTDERVLTKGLPEVDDYFEKLPEDPLGEVLVKKFSAPPMKRPPTTVTNFDPGDIDAPPDNLFNYILRRQGAAYLDVPEQLVREPISKQGYRDPEEVERVIHRYAPMIEYCFRKHTKYMPNTRGYIKVAFKVSYEGYVIPESVRIVNSSIRNRPLEQCIKNYIKHWRDFEKLDESMGIAQVVQKFVFN